MSELQIQQDLSGKVQGFKFAGSKRKKPKHYPEDRVTGLSKFQSSTTADEQSKVN